MLKKHIMEVYVILVGKKKSAWNHWVLKLCTNQCENIW